MRPALVPQGTQTWVDQGSEIVTKQIPLPQNATPIEVKDYAGCGFDLYASRFWALRTMCEADYHGMSPIVDSDLHMVDPAVNAKSTATLRGAGLGEATLRLL